MIGNPWTTGITVTDLGGFTPDGKRFTVSLEFTDNGFCDNRAVDGSLRVRYVVADPVAAVRMLREDAERIGITFRMTNLYAQSGDEPDTIEGWPADAVAALRDLAAEWGWDCDTYDRGAVPS